MYFIIQLYLLLKSTDVNSDFVYGIDSGRS